MLRRISYAVPLAVLAVLGSDVLIAAAQEIENDDTAVAPTASLTLNAFTVLVLVSFLIPTVVGLVTKSSASATVKQIVLLVISAITGLVTTATQLDGTAVISMASAQYALLALGIAIVSYLGIYKPHDANAKLAPTVGIGPSNTP